MTNRRSQRKRIAARLAGAILLLPVLVSTPSFCAEPRVYPFSIDSVPLDDALKSYARITGRQLLYTSELVDGLRAPRLSERLTADEALRRLLAGTAIVVERPSNGVIVLRRAAPERHEPRGQMSNRPGGQRSADQASAPVFVPAPASMQASLADERGEAFDDAEIVVTGTNIRGAHPKAAPLEIIGRDEIDRAGHGSVAQAIAALPQNFGGVATEQSALTLTDNSGTNASLASGANLRGLGADATLILIDGKRLAGSGNMGDFSDLSSIPLAAVDRVEILLDGASALYGSDAVGGVINVILRDRYEGAETRARIGSVTDGGLQEIQLAQTVGTSWSSGSALISYEYLRRSALASEDRVFARSADLRPLGGSDRRLFYSHPGNILAFDPVTGAFEPAFAIPPGQDGTALAPEDFLAGEVNLENIRAQTDLVPRQTRHGLFARATQDLGSRIQISADARYSHRDYEARGIGSPAVIVVTAGNPFFVSPTGAPLDIIAYSFTDELGPGLNSGTAETIGLTADVEVELGGGWQLRSYAAFAQQRERARVDNVLNAQSLSEALGTTPDDPATSFSTDAQGFFNPYGDGDVNSEANLDFIGNGFSNGLNRSRILSFNTDADGRLFDLPAGSVRLAVGGNIRRESFRRTGESRFFTVEPTPFRTTDLARTVTAGFAELRLPVFGSLNARPGLQQLELTAAARIEHYDDFGTTTNPKFGLVWSPVDGLALRSTYGTSFRAPAMRELGDIRLIGANILPQADGSQAAVLLLAGGNPDLRPEQATSWTAGFDFAPARIPGFEASATWYRIDFDRRIARPVLDDQANALVDPALAPFVERVDPASDPADLARVTELINDPDSNVRGGFPPETIRAIIDTRFVNTGKTEVEGVDLSLGHSFGTGSDRFSLAANVAWLLRYRQTLTPASLPVDQLNRPGRPVGLRGRFTGSWTRGALGATATLNHVDRYRDLGGRRIDAWPTLDFQIRYEPETQGGLLSGLSAALSVQNLFDRNPPFYDSPAGIGYDAANADAIGRFISLQLTKLW